MKPDAFASGSKTVKNLVEFAPAGANKMSICFVWKRVRQTKHKTPACAQIMRAGGCGLFKREPRRVVRV